MTPLFEDEALLAFDKPAGLLAVPGRGADKQDCLWHRVRERWPDALVVLILTGAGKAFCAGLDLKELGSGQPGWASATRSAATTR